MSSNHIPRRIVSLQPSATVILRETGKLDLLVACTKYCADLTPEVRNLNIAIVADSWSAQAEQIRALQPDLVIASVPYQEKSVTEILKANTPLLALAPKNLANIFADIALISRIVDASNKGQQVIDGMKGEIAQIREQTKNLPKPRVFCEEWGKPLIASQQWVAELIEAAGGEFIGAPGKQILPEEVAAAAPEVIVTAWCGARDRVPLEKLIEKRNWHHLPAAKNNRVYCIPDEYLNTPAPTLVHGLRALAAAIHPAHFPQPQGLRCINTPR
jgi:iron complex transport system substrate-binding protein